MVATKSFEKNYLVGAKYGRFNFSSAPTRIDTNKLWVWGEVKF